MEKLHKQKTKVSNFAFISSHSNAKETFYVYVLRNCLALQNVFVENALGILEITKRVAKALLFKIFLIQFFLGHQNAHLRRDPLPPLLGTKIHHGIADENAILMVVLRTRLRHPDRPLLAPNDPCHSQSRRLLHHEQQLPKLCFGKMYRLSAYLLPETSSSRKFR